MPFMYKNVLLSLLECYTLNSDNVFMKIILSKARDFRETV